MDVRGYSDIFFCCGIPAVCVCTHKNACHECRHLIFVLLLRFHSRIFLGSFRFVFLFLFLIFFFWFLFPVVFQSLAEAISSRAIQINIGNIKYRPKQCRYRDSIYRYTSTYIFDFDDCRQSGPYPSASPMPDYDTPLGHIMGEFF